MTFKKNVYFWKLLLIIKVIKYSLNMNQSKSTDYTGLQGFVVEKLWVVSVVIFDVESESGIRISLSRQDFEIFEVMCSKNGVYRYF